MLNKIKIPIVTLVAVFGFVGIGATAFPAQGNAALFDGARNSACDGTQLGSAGGNCLNGQETKLGRIVTNAINIFSIIIGIIAVIMIIINGLRYITSGGDSNRVAEARKGIIYAIVGLVIVALAQFIVRFVLRQTDQAINPPPPGGGFILPDNVINILGLML